MRLWHEDLITLLPRQQLLGQHRECCALRGNGWGKKHATVNYVFDYSPMMLYRYHVLIMEEMKGRHYNVDVLWERPLYRGKCCDQWTEDRLKELSAVGRYLEHNAEYLQECIDNLAAKGIIVTTM
ncbi:uncharacterized protein (TIGR02328 family) [Paenibacillus sp. DS2015]|uniref:TIGR02328 family protein n=1 Tax=Paenibacillus sp. DS2015 TaxID=3373917 RepID=UPI003D1EAA0E